MRQHSVQVGGSTLRRSGGTGSGTGSAPESVVEHACNDPEQHNSTDHLRSHEVGTNRGERGGVAC